MIKIENQEVRQINGFPNYFVSSDGKVFNIRGKELKPSIGRNGYARVSINNKNEKHVRKSIHRLVAETYIPNPNNYPQVNHKNMDRTDNRVENLEWCTCIYNLNYSNVIEKASIAKQRRIICISTSEKFDSIKSACEKYNLHHANLVACCNGRRKKCGGMEWAYQ